MTDSGGRPHKEWRKDAKKARRKRIRQQLAIQRKNLEKQRESSPTYQLELEKKRLYEEFLLEKETREREEANKKWLQEEEEAQKKWREEQRLKKLALEEREKEHERIRKEWEKEQKKIKEHKEKLDALKREEERRQKETMERINEFIYKGGNIPYELLEVTESNPGKEICSFYQKVGACRFGGLCSRNHHYYKISNVLLFPNFYTHFTLDQSKSSEYDTDISLEFEDSDMYQHFMEFYNDIVPEFKKFGELTMVKVCCNTEPHLRGNVYIEYNTEREAAIACQNLQGRYYGGRQLHIEFVRIHDWGSAVCGDFVRRRCPKGKSCNFLHIFRNPRNEFSIEWNKKKVRENIEHEKQRCRSWRWSESPGPSGRRTKEKSVESTNGWHESRSSERTRRKSRSPERTQRSRSSERTRRKSRSPERTRRSRSPERTRRKSGSPERKRRNSRSPERKRRKSRSPDRKYNCDRRKHSEGQNPERKRRRSSPICSKEKMTDDQK